MTRYLILSLVTQLIISFSVGQDIRPTLKALAEELSKGNKEALFKLAHYTEDSTRITESWYHGLFETTIGAKARGIIERNTLLLPEEFNWEDSSSNFLDFLQRAYSSIYLDSITEKFLITPVSKRVVQYKLYERACPVTYNIEILLDSIEDNSPVGLKLVRQLIDEKNSRALYVLASKWYIEYDAEIGSLFEQLTNVFVSVVDGNEEWTWTYKKDYYRELRLNHLIYWANHYGDYQWDQTRNAFINKKEVVNAIPPEIELMTAMQSADDSVALKAFIQLTHIDTAIVDRLPIEDFDLEMNDALPIFQESFLEVLTRYLSYCQENNITIELGGRIYQWFVQLANDSLSFKKRYELENEVINYAMPDEISALEYWFLLSEENWDLTFSAGRIIDKFYSYHWKTITHDPAQLKHYLKKAALFDRLGIIGNCNKYLKKFHVLDDMARAHLQNIAATAKDSDVAYTAQAALNNIKISYEPITKKVSLSNYDTSISNLSKQVRKYMNIQHDEYEEPFSQLVSYINYDQIGDFILLIRKKKLQDRVYDFLDNDFGLPVDLEDSIQMREFLDIYNRLSYKDVCRFYLDKLGLPYKHSDGSLDFQSIYEMLEFDVVDPLAGGGNNTRETGLYLVIKLLEFEFNTSLGYPKKICNGGGVYGCSSDDRCRSWMKFLESKKLAKPFVDIPQSISPLPLD